MKQLKIFLFLLFAFPCVCFTQRIGDSLEITSYSGRKYNGIISKLDPDGFFLKASYNREIYISKREIKDFEIISKISKPKPVKKEKSDTTKKTATPIYNQEIIEEETEINLIKKKKEVLLGGWYGFPHIEKIDRNPDMTLGPLGFTADLLFNNNDFSLGIDYIYAQSFSEYMMYNGLIGSRTERWHRVQLRANIGLAPKLKKVHPYIGLGAGTNSRIRTTVDEYGYVYSYNHADFDFSIRVCGGIRFDLSDNISFGTELGLGGGLIRGALYFKP